jgi:hypothetical protein
MVNTPRVYDNGAARSGATYIGNGDVLIRGFLNALDEAIASPNNSVPAGILPFLPAAPAALGGMPAGAGMPVGGYNIVFPYFGAQGGWTHAFFSRIMMDFIHWAFFDTANPMQFTNRASVNALTVMIPRSPASERRAAANAMRAAWA